MKKRSPLPVVVCLAMAWPGLAQEGAKPWTFSGFGTLGLVRGSSGQAAFIRDLSQPNGADRTVQSRQDTRVGLQLDGKLAATLQGTLQAISRYRYDGTFTPEVSWAFLGWNPVPEVRLRAGRLGLEVYMNADSRDVGYTYLTARPPVECLGLIPISSLDGVDLADLIPLGRGFTLRLKAAYGRTGTNLPEPGGTDSTMSGRILNLVADVNTEHWRTRFAFARMRVEFPPPPRLAELMGGLTAAGNQLGDPRPAMVAGDLQLDGRLATWYSAGLSYEEGAIQGQAMLNHLSVSAPLYPGVWSGLGVLGYRLGQVVPYGAWSRIHSAAEGPPDLGRLAAAAAFSSQAQQLVQGVGTALAAFTWEQRTLAAGLRWDFAPHADLKGQVDWIRAQPGFGLWANVRPGWDGRDTVSSLVLDFVF